MGPDRTSTRSGTEDGGRASPRAGYWEMSNRDPEVNPWTLLKDVEGRVRERVEGNLPVRMVNGGQPV